MFPLYEVKRGAAQCLPIWSPRDVVATCQPITTSPDVIDSAHSVTLGHRTGFTFIGGRCEPDRVFLAIGWPCADGFAVMGSAIGATRVAPAAKSTRSLRSLVNRPSGEPWPTTGASLCGWTSPLRHRPARPRACFRGTQLRDEPVAGDPHRLEGIFPIHPWRRHSKQYGLQR